MICSNHGRCSQYLYIDENENMIPHLLTAIIKTEIVLKDVKISIKSFQPGRALSAFKLRDNKDTRVAFQDRESNR